MSHIHTGNSESSGLDRRRWMTTTSATLAACLAAGKISIASDDLPKKKILFFNRSAGFEHSVVKRDGGSLSYAEKLMLELGKKHNFEITCTKDGGVFDKEYENYDAFFFYTTEDLTTDGGDKQPPISKQGKENLLNAVKNGKGFAGSHCASDTFHSPGSRTKASAEIDPYIKMLGGEFIRHGQQQSARMRTADANFPGAKAAGEGFDLHEEWYSLKNFGSDLHVILVQETKGMKDADYDRPPYPATWARKHGEGRVFYTSMGHREDVWTNPIFESILIGGLNWITKRVDAEIPANIAQVTPEASTLPNL